VAAVVEPTAMEGSAVKGTMMNVVTVKKAEPKREPYRNNVGEIRVWVTGSNCMTGNPAYTQRNSLEDNKDSLAPELGWLPISCRQA
jgi:hypothetical protein